MFLKHVVDEDQNDTACQHTDGNRERTFQQGVDLFGEKQTQDDGRYYRRHQLRVELPVFKIQELTPVKHHNRQDGAQLDGNGKHFTEIVFREIEQFFGNDHMTGGRDGQKLREPLYNRDDDALNGIHQFGDLSADRQV